MENLVINDVTQLAHELQNLPPCLICTSCTDYEKLSKLIQYCPNIDIAIGYQHQISKALVNLPLYSLDNLVKKLEMEITMGTNGVKPAFIGVINLSDVDMKNQIWQNVLQSYMICSEQFGIPLIIDHQHKKESQIVSNYISNSKAKLIHLNPYVQVNTIKQQYSITRTINESLNLEQIIVFNKNEIDYELFTLLPILFTPGIKYKTHLQQFGGNGFEIISNNTDCLFQLLKWATQIVKVQETKMWKCPICSKEQPESEERFKKMGKEFCSMKCLRQGLS